MAASMQAACRRLAGGIAQSSPEGAGPEERLTAVARGIDGLFRDITVRYTPLLCSDVFNAVSLAAEQLYRMLTPQVQAWLCRGGGSWSCDFCMRVNSRGAHTLSKWAIGDSNSNAAC